VQEFSLHPPCEGGCGLDSSGSGYRPMAGYDEHVNEVFGSIKDEFLDYLSNSFLRTLLHGVRFTYFRVPCVFKDLQFDF
jgi:hypothetical protein